MMQGDSYSLGIDILKSDKTAVTPDDVLNVEIAVGSLVKDYASKLIRFDSESGKWKFPLSQKETFAMLPSKVKVQVRVLWTSGEVEGVDLGEIRVRESISKEVLR